jgi:hypothetical protein
VFSSCCCVDFSYPTIEIRYAGRVSLFLKRSPLKGGKNKWPPAKTKQKQNNNNEFGESRRLYTFRNAIMHITINATVKVLAGVRSPNPLIHNPSRGNEKWDEDRNISE